MLDRRFEVAKLPLVPWDQKALRQSEAPMLPPFIIDQIRRREEEESRRGTYEQPRLELPVDVYQPAPAPEPGADETDSGRGVVILDLG